MARTNHKLLLQIFTFEKDSLLLEFLFEENNMTEIFVGFVEQIFTPTIIHLFLDVLRLTGSFRLSVTFLCPPALLILLFSIS